jgi:hypothetical protein
MAKRPRHNGSEGVSDDAASAQISNRKITLDDPSDSPSYYANNVHLNVSLFDFRFVFGEILTATVDELRVRSRCSVVMSPQHAKMLAKVLSDNVKDYEQRHGEISLKTA